MPFLWKSKQFPTYVGYCGSPDALLHLISGHPQPLRGLSASGLQQYLWGNGFDCWGQRHKIVYKHWSVQNLSIFNSNDNNNRLTSLMSRACRTTSVRPLSWRDDSSDGSWNTYTVTTSVAEITYNNKIFNFNYAMYTSLMLIVGNIWWSICPKILLNTINCLKITG